MHALGGSISQSDPFPPGMGWDPRPLAGAVFRHNNYQPLLCLSGFAGVCLFFSGSFFIIVTLLGVSCKWIFFYVPGEQFIY